MDELLTLAELAERSGIEPRVIRSYIEQGLLRGPGSRGRNARYTDQHLKRLLAIRALRESRGMALAEVRRTLLSHSDAEITRLAAEVDGSGPGQAPVRASGSALDYLRSIGVAAQEEGRQEWRRASPPAPLEQLLVELVRAAGKKEVARQARGEHWFRVAITPDIELSIRGAPQPEELALVERIADHLRLILLGGIDHD